MLGRLIKKTIRIVGAASTGAAASRGLMTASARLPESITAPMERVNHRGEKVSLISGPTLALAATTAAMVAAGNKRLATAAVIAGATAGGVGWYDDVVGARPEEKQDKGFAGHISALRQGRVSSGLVKVGGIGLAGLVAGWVLYRKPVDAILAGGVIAGTANLLNLLDLRPGRALKAGVVIGAPLLASKSAGVAAGTIGASVALLPEDLGERTMLGDSGANALGALLGVGIAASTSRKGKLAALAVLVGLTAASEKVSFTKVIERTPGLREFDMWGRRAPQPTADIAGQRSGAGINGVRHQREAEASAV